MSHPYPVLARIGWRIAGAGVVLLVFLAGLSAGLVPGVGSDVPAAAAATVCAGRVGENQIRVVVVVDPGAGGPGGPAATCLVVDRGTTGAQLLAQRAGALGVARPRYADSGLLCAIDGSPATGCGERTADGYRYWAYFSGTSGSWVYGSGNPFIRRLADGDVEGWRFVDGTGTGQDPPPRLSPSGLFPPLVTPPPTVPAPVPGPVPGAAPAPPAAGTSAPSAVAGSPGDSPPGSVVAGGGGSPGDSPSGDPATIDGVNGGIGPGGYGSTGSGTGTGDSTDADQRSDDTELAADVAVSSSSPGGPVGVVIAGLVIAALVVATVLRSRARR